MARRTTARPGEFALIARHFAPLSAGAEGAFGLRDDAALVTPAPGNAIVVTTDALVAGVHFLPDDPPDTIAAKLLGVNLSDLAAMGAAPRGYTVALALPDEADEAWVAGYARGLRAAQDRFGVHLLGGDTVATPGPLVLSLTALGEMPADAVLRRSGARPGDRVFVSGTLGDAALGLLALRGDLPDLAAADRAALVERYRRPDPRVALGPRLAGLASACIDVSDGLMADLRHLCEESGVAAVTERARLPLSEATRRTVEAEPAFWAQVLSGGDDYELLFTAPPEAEGTLAALAEELGLAITRIGRIEAAPAGEATVVDETGRRVDAGAGGYTHF